MLVFFVALGKETEQIFWEKHEKDMLEVLMGEAGVEDYYRVRAKKEEKKRRKKEDKKKWDEEMEKLKMDFTALVEVCRIPQDVPSILTLQNCYRKLFGRSRKRTYIP